MKAPLRLSEECLGLATRGQPRRPDLSADFPARHIETKLDWADLVLHPSTLTQVQEIEIWLRHGATLMDQWGMEKKLRPGYRALFYGPPGTGKTMTACLLGKATQREVYKVDLSLVVSKYIGETEKNLARVFDQAQHKGWILFFDEADALFGKRSETRDAHDRYANQEVSFLLQRIETFDGIAILASNQKENIDAAFARRFESIIYFPVPRKEERLRLWRQGFSPKAQLEDAVDLDKISAQHELCGGSIMNVVRYASLQALESGDSLVTLETLQRGIRREHAKEGKGT
jgi:SpoVK/Ycf46/Vps4 family AAA+-type ATPase